MQIIDLLVIVAYLVATAWLGLKLSGKQSGLKDYFLGGRDLPWWAVCLSVVATETSALTVIGIPVMSYLGDISYLQLALGYIVGRVIVAFLMLPRYYDGEMITAYAYLGKRFGQSTQTTAGITFLFTRLLADGIRVLAAAIPLKVILDGLGIHTNYFAIIVVLALVTIVYTFIGGIKAVVWVDVAQMFLYVLGGILAIIVITASVGGGWLAEAAAAGKLQMFVFEGNPINAAGSFIPSFVGGAVFAMASHGSDQIIVQRLLACRTKADAQKALIVSGFVVFVQFAIFLGVGLALWAYYDQAVPADLGLTRDDEIFPLFIIEGLPPGVSGLLLAGILAAAMSTLSSSLSALSSSTVNDVYARWRRTPLTDAGGLRVGRWATIGWGIAFILPATVFESDSGNIVILALGIAGITYGGLLGAFVFGMVNKRATAVDANIAFVLAIAVNAYFFVMEKYVTGEVWVAWQWYPLLGVIVMLTVGGLLSLRHPAAPAHTPAEVEGSLRS
ncbi:sodium:solute symporter [Brevibacterium casei]|uniref:Sodium:solute symporter n=1 Tax=Brevibacterium casei TaxID=33889 RepID=A0AB34XNH0_9MICO|nr:sodium:solute symporter [Brevibacterium casei]SII02082.1 Na+/solute symporter [Mycobacteroides abscessus subsp. abscessus]KZE12320.1 sodium:solute symporter [Brevibacterium casei]MBE4694158.1 sodium/solute symporter [Brevibacterium casei]MBY3577281.1 sodium/solute symporter [Brevibacterium casei]MCT2184381.1 sodium:solute symporter [Brevibacterium casei]